MNFRVFISIPTCLSLLIIASGLPAAVAREKPLRKVLENGLTLIVHQDTRVPMTALHLMLRTDHGREENHPAGLPFLATRLAAEITDQNSLRQLLIQATRLQALPGEDFNHIVVQTLSANIGSALTIISELLKKPVISNLRINHLLEQMKNQQQVAAEDFRYQSYRSHLEVLLPHSFLNQPPLGTAESRNRIKPRQVSAFHAELLRGGNIFIAAVSDLPPGEMTTLLEKHFASLSPGSFPDPPSWNPVEEAPETLLNQGQEQSFVSLALPLPLGSTRDFSMGLVLEALLGGGPGSMLWPLRQEAGLAYDVQARFSPLDGGGLLIIQVECAEDGRDQVLEGMNEIVSRLYLGQVSGHELDMARVNARANWLRRNEERAEYAGNLALFSALRFDPDPIELEKIMAELPNEQVLETARSQFNPRRISRVIIRPRPGPRQADGG